MTRIRRLLAPALLVGAGLAQPALAQTTLPLAFEARGGVALPVGDFNDGAGTGWIVGGTVRYRVNPTVDVYAGYDYASFPPDDDDPDVDVNLRDHGARAGVRADLRVGSLPSVTPWVEIGLMVNRTTVHASDNNISADVDADWALGGEAGAGLSIPVGTRASFTPGVRYRAHKADFGDDIGSTTVSYFAFDLGVQIRL
jgi:opacity protein-like surface antigen